MPIFNVEKYIVQSLESILSQTIGVENLEVIMVNDCSTDNSAELIDEYSRKYDNFISVHLEENSGAAGKPRNVGINMAKGKYLMFLDPDDYFKPNSCEILYEKIEKDNLDVVSGKYDILLENNEKMNVNYQLYNLGYELEYSNNVELFFGSVPTIWAKIFKRSFVLENNITFPEKIPAQDLVFYIHSLLKTKKITFINEKIVTYRKRENEDKSISFNISKNYMSGLTNAYKKVYDLFKNENKEEYFAYVIKNHIIFWSRQLILSELRNKEKIEILKKGSFLFKAHKKFKLKPPIYLSNFFTEIQNENFYEAAILTKELKSRVENEINENKNKMVKKFKNNSKKNIFLICDKIPAELGGLARIVLQKSEYFSKKGHNVKILTIDDDADYEDIRSKLLKRNQISQDVELINIYSYYEEINSKEPGLYYKTLNEKDALKEEENYILIDNYEKNGSVKYFYNGIHVKTKFWDNNRLKNIDFFDENAIRTKQKSFKNGSLHIVKSYQNYDKLRLKRYFTKDGFCYLTKSFDSYGKLKELILFNHQSNNAISFQDEEEFFKYFFTDISNSVSDKPYLICEGSGPIPKISNIDSNIAYKISSLHSNPYLVDYCYGSPMRPIGILEDIKNVDAFVTLTEKQRLDLLKEFGDYNNSFSIPNFVPHIQKISVKKKTNKITMFSRIASEKRLDHAVKAFRLVVDKKPDAILEIYGRATLPREKEELNKINLLIKSLNLENNVFIKGYILDVYTIMAESIATLFTSTFEGFGMVIVESMINSTPVISYDLNYGPSDIIDHGVNGFLAKYSDFKDLSEYIIELLDDPDKAIKMGIAARKTVIERFTSDIIMKQWEDLLNEVPYIEKTENPVIITKKVSQKQNINRVNKLKNKFFSKVPLLYILFNRKNKGFKNTILNIKGYRTIKKNSSFDYDYYLKNNNDVKLSNMDPILHYIYYGFKEGRNPNMFFDNNVYLNNNLDIKNSGINPFIHYTLFGIKENRKINDL